MAETQTPDISTARPDGRRPQELRSIGFQNHIAPYATGSTLIEWGNTRVICGVTVEESVPRWMKEQGLTGGWITGWNAAVVAKGSNGVDVFPSLHCAVSCFLLFFDRRHRPWRYRLYLLPCIGLWFSTIYLRYHYLVDVICGFALAAFALWLANRFPMKSYEIHAPIPGSPCR